MSCKIDLYLNVKYFDFDFSNNFKMLVERMETFKILISPIPFTAPDRLLNMKHLDLVELRLSGLTAQYVRIIEGNLFENSR